MRLQLIDGSGRIEKKRIVRPRIERQIQATLHNLAANPRLAKFMNPALPVPKVYQGPDVRLIILGQDPTIKNQSRQEAITVTLNLDKPGQLRRYLGQICCELGLDIDQHIYATNFLKNVFVKPPTQIKEINILKEFAPYWLPVLQEELDQFPQIPVITLGLPLLSVVVIGGASTRVRDYWGYTPRWKSNERTPFRFLGPEQNHLHHLAFPFPHQPSRGGQFYRDRLAEYLLFVQENTSLGAHSHRVE